MIARYSLAALLGAATLASAAMAESAYPLHLKNCGMDLTFEAAPVRVVTVGQAATEVLYALGLGEKVVGTSVWFTDCLLYTSPSPRDATLSRMPSSA